jgi:hypothetical protein
MGTKMTTDELQTKLIDGLEAHDDSLHCKTFSEVGVLSDDDGFEVYAGKRCWQVTIVEVR